MQGCTLFASKAAHASLSRTKSCRRRAEPMKDQSVHMPLCGGKGHAHSIIEAPAVVSGTKWSYEGAPLKTTPGGGSLALEGVKKTPAGDLGALSRRPALARGGVNEDGREPSSHSTPPVLSL